MFQWTAIRERSYFVLTVSRRFNCGYLGIVAPGPDGIPDSPPQKCLRERRSVRYRSVRGIGLILSDDPEGLLATVMASDRHGASELHS